MAVLSTHTLNAVDGTHAGGVAVTLARIGRDGGRETLFEAETDAGGRLSREIDMTGADAAADYELVLQTAAYFGAQGQQGLGRQITREVVIRFTMPDPAGRYHIPLILSPNGYSVWWSA